MWFSVLSLCLFRLSESLHHISPASLCVEQQLPEMVLLEGGLFSLQNIFEPTEDEDKVFKLVL